MRPQRLDLGLVLVAQMQLAHRAQPLFGNVCIDRLAHQIETFEHVAEHLVEFIEMPLVLNQGRPCQIVKIQHLAIGDVGIHGLQQQ